MTTGALSSTINDEIIATDPTAAAGLSLDTVSRPENPSEAETPALSPSEVGQAAVNAALGTGVDPTVAAQTAGLEAASAVATSQAESGVLDGTLGQAAAAAAFAAGLDAQDGMMDLTILYVLKFVGCE